MVEAAAVVPLRSRAEVPVQLIQSPKGPVASAALPIAGKYSLVIPVRIMTSAMVYVLARSGAVRS